MAHLLKSTHPTVSQFSQKSKKKHAARGVLVLQVLQGDEPLGEVAALGGLFLQALRQQLSSSSFF